MTYNNEKPNWFFKHIMDNLKEGVLITDLNSKIIYVNRALESYSGYSSEELIGKHPSILNAEGTMDEMQKSILESLKNNIDTYFECKNRKKNGDVFLKKFKTSLFLDDNGQTYGYISIEEDITETRKIEDNLNLAFRRYRGIFDNAPIYINLVNKEGILVDSNARSEEFLGYSKEELIGQHYSKFIHPDYVKQAGSTMEILSGGASSGQIVQEYKMVKKDGSTIFVEARTSFLPDMEGMFLHTICFIKDVTVSRKYSEMLQQAAINLQKSNEELEQFAYIASHDMQEPLRVVASYCQLLMDECKECRDKNEKVKKYFNYISDGTTRMKILIKDLLEYSRVGAKEELVEFTDFNGVVREILENFKLRIAEEKAQVIIDNELPILRVIKFRMKQLIHNLISNALKFRYKDRLPVIHVGCYDDIEQWIFYVKDNGIGIDSQYFNRIFGLFKRLYSREEYPGTGIGLAICHKIIQAHGGRIWVESKENEGSCFYFSLPKE